MPLPPNPSPPFTPTGGTATGGVSPFSIGGPVAQILSGATSFSIRNNAGTLDNLIITDAGNATLRGTLSLALAASQIIPGATSFSVRDHAGAVDNFLVLDSGAWTHTGKAGSGSGVAGAGGTIVSGAGGGGNAAGGGLAITLGANTGTGASGQLVIASSSADGQTAMGTIHSLTHTFATLTAAYGSGGSATRMFNVDLVTDNSANGYPGILNSFIANLDINTAVGGTIGKVEAVSGVVNIKAGSGGDLGSGGYATDGEILHNSTQNITGTLRGVQGSIQINSSGSFTTAYAVEGVAITNIGSTGSFTNTMTGVRGYAEHNNTGTIGLITVTQGEANLVSAGTVTGITTGAQGWIHNTGAVTYTGVVNAVWGLTALSGAAVASSAVYGMFGQLQISGTTLGGTTNAAINAEVQHSGTVNPTGALIAIQARWRVQNATLTTVAQAAGLTIQAPVVTSTGANVITNAYGTRIFNQGTTASATSTALRIEAQSGSGTNYAINSLGGIISLASTGGAALFSSASQNLTVSTTTSGTLAVTSAGLLTLTGVGASVWTPGAGATIVSDTVTGITIGTATNQKLGFFNKAPIVQPTQGATLTNNVTVGGTGNQLDNFTSLTVYATDAAAIRNDIYQLGQTLKTIVDGLRLVGLFS